MNTPTTPTTTNGCNAGTASLRPSARVLSTPANDNDGGRHDVAFPSLSSRVRQRFPQKAAAVFVEICGAAVLVALTYCFVLFAFVVEG